MDKNQKSSNVRQRPPLTLWKLNGMKMLNYFKLRKKYSPEFLLIFDAYNVEFKKYNKFIQIKAFDNYISTEQIKKPVTELNVILLDWLGVNDTK